MEGIKRIVLIGGPASGKTTLLDQFDNQNYTLHPEISREIILEFQKKGIDQLFLSDPQAFSQKLLEGRLQQFKTAARGINIYDRGIPDVPAYLKYSSEEIPATFLKYCKDYRYDQIFFLPPWQEIYKQDNERYESWEQAVDISEAIKSFYENLGYNIITVPKANPEKRFQFIKNKIEASE
jgi:predicted ATPase